MVLLVHGYHPLADDGAVYVTGIKKLANPSLYQSDAVFALVAHTFLDLCPRSCPTAPLGTSCRCCCWFATWLRSFSFFSAHGVWRNGYSPRAAPAGERCCWQPAASPFRLRARRSPSWIPTSRHAPFPRRSVFSHWRPCSTRNGDRSILWLALAALLHPLMAGYAAIAMLTLVLARRKMWRALGLFVGLGWLLCAVIFVATRHADPSLAYNRAALSRSYFFLSSWRWYEYPGLLLPLTAAGNRRLPRPRAVACARTRHRRDHRWAVARCSHPFVLCIAAEVCCWRDCKCCALSNLSTSPAYCWPAECWPNWRNAQACDRPCSVFCCWAPVCRPEAHLSGVQPCGMAGARRHAIAGSRPSSGFAPTRPTMRSSRSITITSKAPERMHRAFAQPRREVPWPIGLKTAESPATFLQAARSLVARCERPQRSSTAPPMSSGVARLRPLGVTWIVLPAEASTSASHVRSSTPVRVAAVCSPRKAQNNSRKARRDRSC